MLGLHNTPQHQTCFSLIIKELTAFLFGNGVPESLAYRLYSACNPTTSTVASVRDLFYMRYFLWQKGKYLHRMAKYFDMTLKKFVYLSGSYYTQFDPIGSLEPVIGWPDPALGIDITSCPNMIKSMLQQVQREQVEWFFLLLIITSAYVYVFHVFSFHDLWPPILVPTTERSRETSHLERFPSNHVTLYYNHSQSRSCSASRRMSNVITTSSDNTITQPNTMGPTILLICHLTYQSPRSPGFSPT